MKSNKTLLKSVTRKDGTRYAVDENGKYIKELRSKSNTGKKHFLRMFGNLK